MDISHLSFDAILELFGVIAIIGGGAKMIIEATSPFKKITNHMRETDMKLDNDNKRFKELEQGQKELKDTVNAQSKLLVQMAEHLITGNDVEKLKEKKDELIAHIIDK